MPATLLAAICSPWPLPPTTMPRSAPAADDRARRRRRRSAGSRPASSLWVPRSSTSCPSRVSVADEVLLQREARVVGADRDAHRLWNYSWCRYWCRSARWRRESTSLAARRRARAVDGIRGSTESDVARGRRRRRATIGAASSSRARPALGYALYSDRSEIALRMLTRGDARADARLLARAAASRRSVSRVARHRRDGLPAGPRRGGPAAVADRRSLRRLPRGPGALAGRPIACCRRSRGCSSSCCAGRHPGAQRSARAAARRARAAGRGRCTATVPETIEVREGRGRLRGRSVPRPEDRAVPRSAREPRWRRRATRAAGCSTRSATTAASRWRWRRACDEVHGGRHLGGGRRAHPRERGAQRPRATSRRGR